MMIDTASLCCLRNHRRRNRQLKAKLRGEFEQWPVRYLDTYSVRLKAIHPECPRKSTLGQGTECVLRLRDKPGGSTQWNKHLNTLTESDRMGSSIRSAPNVLPPSPMKNTKRISLPLRIPMIVYFRSLAKHSDITSPHFNE